MPGLWLPHYSCVDAETWIIGKQLRRGHAGDSHGSAGCSGCGLMSWLLRPWGVDAAIAAIAISQTLDNDDGN